MQWLIDIVAARVIDTIGIPPVFIDRGDPADKDFIETDFTIDDNWHELDLSAIVPAGASAVSFTFAAKNTGVDRWAFFRRAGNTNSRNLAQWFSQTADILLGLDMVISLDPDRKIEYFVRDRGVWTIALVVKGWWL